LKLYDAKKNEKEKKCEKKDITTKIKPEKLRRGGAIAARLSIFPPRTIFIFVFFLCLSFVLFVIQHKHSNKQPQHKEFYFLFLIAFS